MSYDDDKGRNRENSNFSQPYKRKRISTSHKSNESGGDHSFRNNEDKRPLYSSDKTFRKYDNSEGRGRERDPRNRNNYGNDFNNRDAERPFVKKSTGGGQGYKKSYNQGSRPGGPQTRYDKPWGKPSHKSNFVKPRQAKPRQPDYHFDDEAITGPIRLNKFIANTGLCSRREADQYIQAGLITVNGQLITELGSKVMATDDVCYNGSHLAAERKVYILLNKPKDYVTSVDDPHAKRTVMELVEGACRERIYPVGRLDRMTTGVLLLTNDGELTKKLTHPTSQIRKVYQVQLDKTMKVEDMHLIQEGISLDDGFIKADKVSHVFEDDKSVVGVEIHSGRNRIIRRLFEKVGYRVLKLDRVYFGGLTKKGLSRGKWRYLAPREVGFLKMLKA